MDSTISPHDCSLLCPAFETDIFSINPLLLPSRVKNSRDTSTVTDFGPGEFGPGANLFLGILLWEHQ